MPTNPVFISIPSNSAHPVIKWRQQDSNLRPFTRQANALPAELCLHADILTKSRRNFKHNFSQESVLPRRGLPVRSHVFLFLRSSEILIPPLPSDLLQLYGGLSQLVILFLHLFQLGFIALPAFGKLALIFRPQALHPVFIFLPALNHPFLLFLLELSQLRHGLGLEFLLSRFQQRSLLLPGGLQLLYLPFICRFLQKPALYEFRVFPPVIKAQPASPAVQAEKLCLPFRRKCRDGLPPSCSGRLLPMTGPYDSPARCPKSPADNHGPCLPSTS